MLYGSRHDVTEQWSKSPGARRSAMPLLAPLSVGGRASPRHQIRDCSSPREREFVAGQIPTSSTNAAVIARGRLGATWVRAARKSSAWPSGEDRWSNPSRKGQFRIRLSGAEEGTRTLTRLPSLAPQASVSTNSTTSARRPARAREAHAAQPFYRRMLTATLVTEGRRRAGRVPADATSASVPC